MARTITIPTCASPFYVIVNGVEYSYEAGDTVSVPDEVAEVIEHHVNSVPKEDPLAGVSLFKQLASGSIVEVNTEDLEGVKSIRDYAFNYCYALTGRLELPDSITAIGKYAFSSCVKLKHVVVPDSVTSLGGWCLSYLSEVESLKLPANITSLPEGAVCHNLKLSYLEIPEKVTSIGGYQQCGANVGGATIAIRAKTPPTLASNHSWTTSNTKQIIVPKGTLSKYKSATNWSSLASLMKESTEW